MADERIWKEWPACLRCGHRRQTVCPTCGVAGNRFPLAEYQGAAEPQRNSRVPPSLEALSTEARSIGLPSPVSSEPTSGVLLLCPRCDEAFMPRFYRICPACGCDAGSGVELKRPVVEQISNRLLLAVYGLVALGGLLLLYFWFLFRRG